ncbi:MAG: GNAT family N-acetyltransferase [Chloroflexota bacterium]
MIITDRAYRGMEDFTQLSDFLGQVRFAIDHSHYLHQGDLTWQLFHMKAECDLSELVHLWEDSNGKLVGFVVVYAPYGLFDIQVHPHHRNSVLEQRMIEWAEAQSRILGQEGPDAPPSMAITLAHERDMLRRTLLEQLGYTSNGVWHYLACSLDMPLPQVALPQGFQVRSVKGQTEAALRAEVLAAAFGAEPDTGRYQHFMQAPNYAANLDLVAVAPEGTFGAFCMCWVDSVNRVGQFEPVGTAPQFRKQGLARATLTEGLRRMQQAGATTAMVIVDEDEQPAKHLYEAVGLIPQWVLHMYTKDY